MTPALVQEYVCLDMCLLVLPLIYNTSAQSDKRAKETQNHHKQLQLCNYKGQII